MIPSLSVATLVALIQCQNLGLVDALCLSAKVVDMTQSINNNHWKEHHLSREGGPRFESLIRSSTFNLSLKSKNGSGETECVSVKLKLKSDDGFCFDLSKSGIDWFYIVQVFDDCELMDNVWRSNEQDRDSLAYVPPPDIIDYARFLFE